MADKDKGGGAVQVGKWIFGVLAVFGGALIAAKSLGSYENARVRPGQPVVSTAVLPAPVPSTAPTIAPATLSGELTAEDKRKVQKHLPLVKRAVAICPKEIYLKRPFGVWKVEHDDMCESNCPQSPTGPKGPAQISKATAKDYGVRADGQPGEANIEQLDDALFTMVNLLCKNGGNEERALIRYHGSGDLEKDRAYAAKVIYWEGKFEQYLNTLSTPSAPAVASASGSGQLNYKLQRSWDNSYYPIPIGMGEVSSRTGPRFGRIHKGHDVACDEGTPVHAIAGGKVIKASWNRTSKSGEAAGVQIIIDHGDGRVGTLGRTMYDHLREDGLQVKVGDVVQAGQLIALSGKTGINLSGPHLHFETLSRHVAGGQFEYDSPLDWVDSSRHIKASKKFVAWTMHPNAIVASR